MSDKKPAEGEAAAEGDAAAAAAAKKKKLIIIVAAVLLLAGGGGGAWFFLGHKGGEHAEEAAHEEPVGPPVYYAFEQPFTSNLQSGPTGYEITQIAMHVRVKDAKASESMKTYAPEVRGAILELLSSKTGDEILSTEGKNALKEAIKKTLNGISQRYEKKDLVEDVIFTSFIVQ